MHKKDLFIRFTIIQISFYAIFEMIEYALKMINDNDGIENNENLVIYKTQIGN
ncbi:hypothetical protein EOM39_06265 [Candidatus Gracilibacteria bacterium]|nr:hypothetical protein [Candidatus Gracilibacteria bacterium]